MKILLWLFLISASATELDLYDFLNEVSWPLKQKLLNLTNKKPQPVELVKERRAGIKAVYLRSATVAQTEVYKHVTDPNEEAMKMKIFRRMHEILKENDKKNARAVTMRDWYLHNSYQVVGVFRGVNRNPNIFKLGSLIGKISTEFEAMNELSKLLNKFHDEWETIEHINAYEKIWLNAHRIGSYIEHVRKVEHSL